MEQMYTLWVTTHPVQCAELRRKNINFVVPSDIYVCFARIVTGLPG